MRAAEIFEVDAIRFIEPAFADLTVDAFTRVFTDTIDADQARLLIDKAEYPLALALREPDRRWISCTFLFRKPTRRIIERFEETNGDIYQEEREVWAGAVRDYYAREIMAGITPAIEDLNPDRTGIIEKLLRSVWSTRPKTTCLDCCCGSGVGSVVLRKFGMTPLSIPAGCCLRRRCASMRPGPRITRPRSLSASG
jgi:hypothetical protein